MIKKALRFHGHNSVSKVRGQVNHSRLYSVRSASSKRSNYRLAVVVSKKIAPHATTRNRIRRRTFEFIRKSGLLDNKQLDVVVYAKTADLAEIESANIEKDLSALLKKISREK